METAVKMNLAQEFLKVHLKRMESADKALVVTSANKFTQAKRSNSSNINNVFQEYFACLRNMEQKYGFMVLDTQTSIATMEEIAAAIELATNKLQGGKSAVCRFSTVDEANFWLANQRNIVVKNIIVDARCCFGVRIQSITLEYVVTPQPIQRQFGIQMVSKYRAFVSSNQKKFNKKWQEQNPAFSLIKSVKKAWRFSLIGGSVGFFRFIGEKYFVLYAR